MTFEPPLRDHNGECLGCDELYGHAPDCPLLENLIARLRTAATCIQPDYCAAMRRQAAEELAIMALALKGLQ